MAAAKFLKVKFTLQELLEQKALLEKHLDLINSRIEEIEGKRAPLAPGPSIIAEAEKPAVQPETGTVEKPAPLPVTMQAATATIEAKPPTDEATIKQMGIPAIESQATMTDTRKGCLVWTGIIGALTIAALILIYIFYPSWDEDTAKERFKDLQKEEESVGR